MQITDKIFASYLECEYKGYLKFIGKSGIKTELENLNNETLNNIKEHYIETISSKIKNEYIQKDLLITIEVLKKGFHYLLNNSIQNNEIGNILDVLVRKTGESFLGNYFYEPMLILPNFKITKREKLLLTFKSILISNLQKKLLSTGKIIYGKPVKALTVHFSGLHDEANTIISKIRQFSNNEKSPNFFLNKHCNFCVDTVHNLGRKKGINLSRGRKEIWAASIIYVIARLNFLFDKENKKYIKTDTICNFFNTNKSTVGNKATQIEKACNLTIGAEGYCSKQITDSLTFYQTPEGFIIPKSMIEDQELVVEFSEGEDAEEPETFTENQKKIKEQKLKEQKERRAEINRKIAEKKKQKKDYENRQLNLFDNL